MFGQPELLLGFILVMIFYSSARIAANPLLAVCAFHLSLFGFCLRKTCQIGVMLWQLLINHFLDLELSTVIATKKKATPLLAFLVPQRINPRL
jgi:hypothetical protein